MAPSHEMNLNWECSACAAGDEQDKTAGTSPSRNVREPVSGQTSARLSVVVVVVVVAITQPLISMQERAGLRGSCGDCGVCALRFVVVSGLRLDGETRACCPGPRKIPSFLCFPSHQQMRSGSKLGNPAAARAFHHSVEDLRTPQSRLIINSP